MIRTVPPKVDDPPQLRSTEPTGLREFVGELRLYLKNQLSMRYTNRTAAPFLLLASPSGKTYKVTVDDDGNIATELQST